MALNLNFKIAKVSKKEIEEALKAPRTTRYNGPTPPEGEYRSQIKKIWAASDKNGNPILRVMWMIAEPEGEKSKYNGAVIFQNLRFPSSGEDQYTPARLNAIGNFLFIFTGRRNRDDVFVFMDCLSNNKVRPGKIDETKNTVELLSVGKIKFDNKTHEAVIAITHGQNDRNPDKPFLNLYYVNEDETAAINGVESPNNSSSNNEDDIEDDLDGISEVKTSSTPVKPQEDSEDDYEDVDDLDIDDIEDELFDGLED